MKRGLCPGTRRSFSIQELFSNEGAERMGEKFKFILGLHNHQPVGNFDHVIEEAYNQAYAPFIEVMQDYPDISFALHNSGILWDWLEKKHPEYLEKLAEMVTAGRVEIMSAGYYEPILMVIPERDRQGQLSMMSDYVQKRFKTKPRGCWLTERIWDPHLPHTLADAGLEYIIVDDSHFKSTGFDAEELRGYFLTEENGSYVNVFPIDKKLRYLIPFHDPEEVIRYLREVSQEKGSRQMVSVLADDGEKFGLWPGTHSLCYGENWLRRFCDALRANDDWLETTTFSKVIDTLTPRGIVYLPTASYVEMMEWALSLKAREAYNNAKEILASSGNFADPEEVLRGGLWRNFLVKYEESNWMHKRMLGVSEAVEEYRKKAGPNRVWKEARGHLYQAQCNCAYWHGLFGGLYLPHLRSAIFNNLVAADTLIEEKTAGRSQYVHYVQKDIDGDGVEELVASTPLLKVFLKLRGGVLREFDVKKPAFNLTDTLTRREELYHRNIAGLDSENGQDGDRTASIHDFSVVKEEGLENSLFYDRSPRASLVDHFLPSGSAIGPFAAGIFEELGDFMVGDHTLSIEGSNQKRVFRFSRKGQVLQGERVVDLLMEKSISLSALGSSLGVDYSITPRGSCLKSRFAVENVFSFQAGDAPDRYFMFPDRKIKEQHLASAGEEENVSSFSMIDEWLGLGVNFDFQPVALLWRFPIETVSNSDSGFERVYQGSALVPVWDLDLSDGETFEIKIKIQIDFLK